MLRPARRACDPAALPDLLAILRKTSSARLRASAVVAMGGIDHADAAASILKNAATQVVQRRDELMLELMGHQGLGWEGEGYTEDELGAVRGWLSGKAMSIYGGSSEIQNNIIAKNILGLPETTQRG